MALIVYSHHVPGMEAEDDKFFDLAVEKGFYIAKKMVLQAKHMWRSDDTVDMYVVELRMVTTS